MKSSNGERGNEASFRLDGSPSQYKVVATKLTNEYKTQTVDIIPGVTFALFHVHTFESGPARSSIDRRIADKYKLKIYSIHRLGLYVYCPVTKKTARLRHGVAWIGEPSRIRAVMR